MNRAVFVFVGALVAFWAIPARASCEERDARTEPCVYTVQRDPPPPPPPPPPYVPPVVVVPKDVVAPPRGIESFDERRGWSNELGAGPWVSMWRSRDARDVTPGIALHFGRHHVRAPLVDKSEKSEWPVWEPLRWCAPIVCGGILGLFMPADALLGNEYGFDLHASFAGSTESLGGVARVTGRPSFQYAQGSYRTQTTVGMFLPELGVQWQEGRGAGFVVNVPIFSFDVLVHAPIAIGIEPLRAGVVVPLDHPLPIAYEGSAAIRMYWLR